MGKDYDGRVEKEEVNQTNANINDISDKKIEKTRKEKRSSNKQNGRESVEWKRCASPDLEEVVCL